MLSINAKTADARDVMIILLSDDNGDDGGGDAPPLLLLLLNPLHSLSRRIMQTKIATTNRLRTTEYLQEELLILAR